MILLTIFVFILQTSFAFRLRSNAGCTISIFDLHPEPIIISTKTFGFLYPSKPGEISVNAGETIIISCPGGQLLISEKTQLDTSIQATCQSDTHFKVHGKTIDFKNIVCSDTPYNTARFTGKSCENGGKQIEVGFVLSDSSFVRQMLICFDDKNLNTLYSLYNLTRAIDHRVRGAKRPFFTEDSFYNLDVKVNDLYKRKGQKTTINNLLGLDPSSSKYIKDTMEDSADYYLARGHLAANADFVYKPQQKATFHYVNVAPQWQTFNGDNWKNVEISVRNYANRHKLNLKVYTGTYGVATLPHAKTGERIPLYLYDDGNGNKRIPVPELYWKVVYDPASEKGIALLGLNNPYEDVSNLQKSVICQDISPCIDWVDWKPDNQKSGFSYACTIDDLRKKIPYLPQFEVKGVLL